MIVSAKQGEKSQESVDDCFKQTFDKIQPLYLTEKKKTE